MAPKPISYYATPYKTAAYYSYLRRAKNLLDRATRP